MAHWHYNVEKSGPCRYISKVTADGVPLCSFAEVFPYPEAEEAAEQMEEDANAWRDLQRRLRVGGHKVEQFYEEEVPA